MKKIRKFLAPEFVFGPGAMELLGQYIVNFGGKRVFLVTDNGLSHVSLVKQTIRLISEAGAETVVYDAVSPNPRDYEVMAGADAYLHSDCDLIVALGGGSPMDCAKGIGIISTNHRDILTFEGIDKVDIPGPPLICIPTTAGSSADVSQFAVINNSSQQLKVTIISKAVVPDVALIDPITTLSMDRHLTVCTGLDALVHAIEAYVSTASSPITDLHALEAIRLIMSSLPLVVDQLDDLVLREKMMLASLEAGLAFSNASLGAVHAMAHGLGGLLNLPHGECNALLLDHVVNFNYDEASERYNTIGLLCGLDFVDCTLTEGRQRVVGVLRDFKKRLGLVDGLAARGVNSKVIGELAHKAMEDPCIVTNPKRPTHADIETIFREAF